MRLRKRQRVDTLQNETRRRGRSWGRWIYLALLALFASWIVDTFAGDLLYLRAEGLVLRDRRVLATQHTALICELDVVEGEEVKAKAVVAKVCSQQVEETLAKLASEIAQVSNQIAQLSVRRQVIEASIATAKEREEQARLARSSTKALRAQQLISNSRYAQILDEEVASLQARSQMEAEYGELKRNLPQLERTRDAAVQARERLAQLYENGAIRAPSNGIVGYLRVSSGSVIRPGETIMEVFTGKPYVLAYVPEGALYSVDRGERVKIRVGLDAYVGRVAQVFDMSQQLPKEFQDSIRPPPRARVVRVEFDSDDRLPTLFAKTHLSRDEWLPNWMERAGRVIATTSKVYWKSVSAAVAATAMPPANPEKAVD